MIRTICLYMHVHQPFRIREYSIFDAGHDTNYWYDSNSESPASNEFILRKVADKSYRPTNKLLKELLHKHPEFHLSLSITGTLIEQLEMWAPDVLQEFKDLVDTGRVEIVGETYHHSLAFFYSVDEFERQVLAHKHKVKQVFGVVPKVLRNTELAYNNDLAQWADKAGYKGVIAEGWDPVLQWRSSNFMYRPAYTQNIRLMLKNYKLSDDIAFRFSDQNWGGWPLTAEKYDRWVADIPEDQQLINLFMDYETFGEHQWEDHGIFDFMRHFPDLFLKHEGNRFLTLSQAIKEFEPVDTIDVPHTVTWADTERDLSAWLGNSMQTGAIKELYALEKDVLATGNHELINDWRRLQTSDHFYYMCTKWFNDGDVHAYFSPYESPYEAFMYFCNALRDVQLRMLQLNTSGRKRLTRPILLSNGHLHVGINLFGMVHDLYFPHVGGENHARADNMRHRIGVWTEGKFSWLDDGSWMFAMDYAHEAQVGHITASNTNLGVTLEFIDCVAADHNLFLRNIHIVNAHNTEREIRLFMGQAMLISNSLGGDTVQYLPHDNALLHFKGHRHFVIGGKGQDGQPFNQHAMGLFGIEGHQGTYRDAEDGLLVNNAVEYGKVDSVVGFTANLKPYDSTHFEYWMAVATTRHGAIDLHRQVTKAGLEPYFDHTVRHWRRWLGPVEHFTKTLESKDWQDAFQRSALVLASQIDHDGAVIASTDTTMLNYARDTYAYCWPRDVRLVATAPPGYKTEIKMFFEFCVRAIDPEGFMSQKFSPDASLGSTWHPYVFGDRVIPPIQEDETAAVVFLLAGYVEHNKDKETLHKYYESLVVPMANFMASYINEKTKLPHASYDLWEEKFLTTTYTVSLVYAALSAAARMAEQMKRPKDAVRWQTVADDMPEAAAKLLFNKETGYFYRGFLHQGDKIEYEETIDISSFYGAFAYGLFSPDSRHLKQAYKTLERVFHLKDDGPTILQRYEHDQYFTVDPAGLGNPWFVTSLWMAQYDMLTGNLERAKKTIDWVRGCMLSTGVLSEQINPFTQAFTSVAPLTWSQAEFLNSIIDMQKYSKED